jgi:cytochrome c
MNHALRYVAVACAIAFSAHEAPAQDAVAGKTAYAACSACHATDGSNGAGPGLRGIIGRKAGSLEGFRYSRAMKAAAITWDAASLDAYLADPQKSVPGNVMPFSGIPDARQRADLIAYLATLSAAP